MKNTTKRAAVAASGIAALTLLSAMTHADSFKYADAQSLYTTMDEAVQVALNTVSGTLIEAELEMDNNQAIWEIDIVNSANQVVSVEIDGQTGQLLGTEASDHSAPNLTNVVSLNEALEMVRSVNEGALVEIELENDDDQWTWEIEAIGEDSQEIEYRIDGTSGEFI